MTVQKTKTLVAAPARAEHGPAARCFPDGRGRRAATAAGAGPGPALWCMTRCPRPRRRRSASPRRCSPWRCCSGTRAAVLASTPGRRSPCWGSCSPHCAWCRWPAPLLLGRWSWRFDSRRAAGALCAGAAGAAAGLCRAGLACAAHQERILRHGAGARAEPVLRRAAAALPRPRRALAPWFAALGLLLLLCFAAANHLPEGLGIRGIGLATSARSRT